MVINISGVDPNDDMSHQTYHMFNQNLLLLHTNALPLEIQDRAHSHLNLSGIPVTYYSVTSNYKSYSITLKL